MSAPLPGSAREGIPAGGHASRLSLIQLRGNALDAADRAAVEAHLASCARCTDLLGNLRSEAAAFEREFPTWNALKARPVPEAQPGRASRAEPGPAWWIRLVDALRPSPGPRAAFAGLLVLAAVGSVLWMRGPAPAPSQQQEAYTAKGAASASFYLFVNGRQAATDTLVCGPGDSLQLGISGQEPVHYSVLYQDDQDPVRPYMADADGSQAPLGNSVGENLPHSLILKGTWKRELLHCLWSPVRFTPEEAAARVRDGENPSRPDIRLRTFTLVAPR